MAQSYWNEFISDLGPCYWEAIIKPSQCHGCKLSNHTVRKLVATSLEVEPADLQACKASRFQGFRMSSVHSYKPAKLQAPTLSNVQMAKVSQCQTFKLTRLQSIGVSKLHTSNASPMSPSCIYMLTICIYIQTHSPMTPGLDPWMGTAPAWCRICLAQGCIDKPLCALGGINAALQLDLQIVCNPHWICKLFITKSQHLDLRRMHCLDFQHSSLDM